MSMKQDVILVPHSSRSLSFRLEQYSQSKPELPAGTILTVKEKWQNFYGKYYRCYLPDEMKDKGYSIPYYDIPADKAEVIEL